jgi:hypothetical protein
MPKILKLGSSPEEVLNPGIIAVSNPFPLPRFSPPQRPESLGKKVWQTRHYSFLIYCFFATYDSWKKNPRMFFPVRHGSHPGKIKREINPRKDQDSRLIFPPGYL